jgi:hypothetical protein
MCVCNCPPRALLLQVGVFDFGSRSSPVVLLLDRSDDPVTPLLTQWTYQVRVCACGEQAGCAHTKHVRQCCGVFAAVCAHGCKPTGGDMLLHGAARAGDDS